MKRDGVDYCECEKPFIVPGVFGADDRPGCRRCWLPVDTVEAVIVCRVAVASLGDAERLIDVWLRAGEDDDRLISFIVTDRASLAQEGASA